MTTDTTTYREPDPELRRRTIPAGEARVAVFTRTYQTTVEDLWDACTHPDRLRRWYVPITGELRVGGTFQQVNMGSGTILICDAPHFLKLSLGSGADEIELRLSAGPGTESTTLELQHATTRDSHAIGGKNYDAIFCMGGGYYPRLQALDIPTCARRSSAAAQPWPRCSTSKRTTERRRPSDKKTPPANITCHRQGARFREKQQPAMSYRYPQ